MLSRVAESVFWMARYMERTDGLLRVLRTNYIASQDEMLQLNWQSVLQTYGYLSASEIEAIKYDTRAVLRYVMLDKDNDASLINNITRSRENARSVQDHITKEMWQALNSFYHLIREYSIEEMVVKEDPVTALDGLIKHGLFLQGTIMVTMARGEAYSFLNIGKYLERAIITTDVLDIKLREIDYNLQHAHETSEWRYLLYSLSGYELYLKAHRGVIYTDLVIEQVLYNLNFAHSILYCLNQLNRYFVRLRADSIPERYGQLEFLIGKAVNKLKYSARSFKDGMVVKQLLQQSRSDLVEISNAFNHLYFGY